MNSNERSGSTKLWEYMWGGVPFKFGVSDRGHEIQMQQENIDVMRKVAETLQGQNTTVVETILPQAPINPHDFLNPLHQSMLEGQRQMDDVLYETQSLRGVVSEVAFTAHAIEHLVRESTYAQQAIAEALDGIATEQRVFNEMFREMNTTLPEAVLQELLRTEKEAINIPATHAFLQQGINTELRNAGANNRSNNAIAEHLALHMGHTKEIQINAEAEIEHMKRRSDALSVMMKLAIAAQKEGRMSDETMQTAKKALREFMETEVVLSGIARHFQRKQIAEIVQLERLHLETKDSKIIERTTNVTRERISSIHDEKKIELSEADRQLQKCNEVLLQTIGIELPTRTRHDSSNKDTSSK